MLVAYNIFLEMTPQGNIIREIKIYKSENLQKQLYIWIVLIPLKTFDDLYIVTG